MSFPSAIFLALSVALGGALVTSTDLFSAAFPSAPKYEARNLEHDSPAFGHVRYVSHKYLLELGDSSYGVMCHEFPRLSSPRAEYPEGASPEKRQAMIAEDRQALMESAAGSTVKSLGVDVKKKETIHQQGAIGFAHSGPIVSRGSKQGAIYRGKVLVWGDRFFHLFTVTPATPGGDAASAAFFESFSMVPPPVPGVDGHADGRDGGTR